MTVFTDRMDDSTHISLYEYGIIRNPKTNKCVVCTNRNEELYENSLKPIVKVFWLDFDDVKEALGEAEDGYFNFIGSTRKEELRSLDNNFLTGHIHSLEMYNGAFDLY